MKYKSILLIILAVTVTIVSSCKKEKGPAVTKNDFNVDIYTAGYVVEDAGIAAYWKNDKITKLGPGIATGIAVNGNDVYVVGYSPTANNKFAATYWKNGERNILADPTESSQATGIAISGNDIYISGNIYISSVATIAAYWKNGQLNELGNATAQKSSVTRTITVQNNDVYVSGDIIGKDSVTNATYWKNGTAVTLNTGKNHYLSNLFALTVNGNDIYSSGQIYGPLRPDLIEYSATYWKNGVPQSFTDVNSVSLATAILVKNNDVYVIGEKQAIGQLKIVGGYWKNGVFTELNNGIDGSEVHSAAMQGDNIYMGGNISKTVKIKDEDILVNYPGYWKNGKSVQLSTEYGEVNSIVVVNK